MTGRGVWVMDWSAVGTGLFMTFAAVAGISVLRTLARINSRLHEALKQLEDMRAGLIGADSSISPSFHTSQDDPDMPPIEMVSLGGGDPRTLIAATLEASTFPRLATLLNEAAVESAADWYGDSDEPSPEVGAIYDTPDKTELLLRQEFSRRARCRDYAGLLDVGRRICKLLPDRPIAAEYERLEPVLIRKAAAAKSDRTPHRVQASPGAIVFDHPKRASG